MHNPNATSAKGLYSRLEADRDPFLRRARDAAKLTIPSLLPEEGHNGTTKLKTPFQSLGARGVNNLSSKLLMALMPPNSPFFRLRVDNPELKQAAEESDQVAELEKALGQIEKTVMTEIEKSAIRVSVGETLKQLLVAGNALLYVKPGGGAKVFKIDSYVVRRDPEGTPLDTVVKESVSLATLPEKVRTALQDNNPSTDRSDHDNVDLYTHIYRDGDKWTVYQEVDGLKIPGTEGSYPLEKSPWIPLRFTQIDGENYGRGYVEEYYGDLRSLEALTKTIVEGSAAAARILFLVNPNGTTQKKTLQEAPNGAIRSGNSNDVSVLQMEKQADFSIAYQTIGTLTERLSYGFLLNSAIQRDAERVTAEEIRYMANELESALGGVYSILSQEFQLPLVRRLMYVLENKDAIPSLPEDAVSPSITTGIEALGRGHDLEKLDLFIKGMADIVPPEVLSQHVDFSDYMTRRATALGIETDGLIKSQEQIAREQAAAQQAAMRQRLAEQAMETGGKAVEKMTPQGPNMENTPNE
ncbi:hypothetical protein GCM10007160_18270 [Litchfieldella qijiaojingensis]|uniref:Head-to-tail joining protein n=1 Tax=Litchfieldella qijiaojingensis TaxID=980347 RepID=A0ABQ2YPP1_9GAMM|nr:portal protein [Halomonas qijiaojingensis]GGX91133.1 hypothetical protein GCM10007160_18270 [Halomonas qijiaojingensis]